MTDAEQPLLDRLRAMVGVPSAPEVARDAVNPAMIRHWCDAMEDANPMRALDEAGFTSVIATNSEHEYLRYLRPGDLLSGANELVDVSEEKLTGLGRGHFVTSRTSYRTRSGEEVGRMFFRLLKFRPGTGRPSARTRPTALSEPRAFPSRPPRRETTLRAAEVRAGDALPPCPVPITTTLIVAGAIASRDYQDVHHDRDAAIRRGTPDIFMNILTSSGLVARYVTDWAGPEVILAALRIRLGAPNHPGDTMLLSGRVAQAEAGRVEVALSGRNRLGDHVTGTVELRLP